ncbi:MAG TPA: hypothetical protein VJ816_02010, partial [Gemmatimonadales bacterium]|nr:hypothetical protein [Gemmatimonadales bacterium]
VWQDGGIYPPRPAELADDAAWPPDTGGGQLWIGSAGKLVAGTYGDDPQLLDRAKMAEITAHPVAKKYPRSEGVYAEWIAAAKGGAPAGSAFDRYAGPFTEMVLLGCLAVRMGKALDIDPATGAVKNATVPPAYIQPTYRSGWTL